MNPDITLKLESFFNQYPALTYKKGEIVIRADEPPSGIFYIQKGVIRQYTINSSGEENTLNLFNTRSFIPMTWALAGVENTYFFETVNEVIVRKAPKEDVLTFLEENSDVFFDLTARAFRGLDGLLKRIEFLMSKKASTKVAYALYNIATRFAEGQQKNVVLPLHMTHNDLATIAGVTRETFSRELRKLENDDVIDSQDRSIRIIDIQRLEEELV